ncbi:Fe-S cluster assembly protein SufD [Legionella oakridgensis]|uniref:FeS assembly protein SufD n=2 Tax=Legionella oakridgensis TaxID=29423 RepID=W0BBD1_9GAMM|nr:Fe-S cluster assembly protein SufD [Legionella oakridgensis]AHE67823.1 FeS assembly protein SufD [Legionella oakridgensis ATCC 33761 = DSM 21215]KTD44068.1 ABC transporter permease [Legionella oakridgensis]STY20836.1 ABC transporter permease [Legionella longbeachae]
MSELLDFYQQQAALQQSQIPWLANLQKKALADFAKQGFPARHHEDWKYTTIDSFLKQRFSTKQTAQVAMQDIRRDIPDAHLITIANGTIIGLDTVAAHLPEGVIVQPLTAAWCNYAEKMELYLGKILQHEHGFQALNTAMLQQGLFIYLPKGIQLEKPLAVVHWQGNENQAVYSRHVVVAEAGSSISFIEDFQGKETCCYFTNTVTEMHAAKGATIHHYKIQRESRHAYHVGHVAVSQAADSEVNSHSLSLGGKLVRSDISIRLSQSHARCLLNGIYALGEEQHVDHHTLVSHEAADCQSVQDYKGILGGASRAVFNGKVYVAKGAQHTEAKQQNKNLLLSKNAEIDTKPQLEIFADDVICTHGATVGQLDEEALFYLATRGIDRVEASRYLIEAFAANNLQQMANLKLADWMRQLLLTVCRDYNF